MDSIQDAFNNAMAQSLGYRDADALMESVPVERRLPVGRSRQHQFNHALALHFGFDSVEDLVNANGMSGTKGLKGKEF